MKLRAFYIILLISLLPGANIAFGAVKDTLSDKKSERLYLDNSSIENIIEDISETYEDNQLAAQWKEVLYEMSENPVELNSASREELESIPFLTRDQTEALSYYLYRYGPIADISELRLVDGFDEQTVRFMRIFARPGIANPKDSENHYNSKIFNYGKHEIDMSTGRSIYKGIYSINTNDNEEKYKGDMLKFSFKYGFNYKNKIQWGIVAQKDEGEKWIYGKYSPDYTSFHFLMRDWSKIKTFVAGDYSLSFGQGLVCGNSFNLGKSFTGTNTEVCIQNIRRHFSTSESDFLRGMALSLSLNGKNDSGKAAIKRWETVMTTFISSRKLDGNVNGNSFSSIYGTGLHRTGKEISGKGQIGMLCAGFNITYYGKRSEFGITNIIWKFNKDYRPEWKPYNCFYARGNKGGNASFNYRFSIRNSILFGETAIDINRNIGAICGISFKPYRDLSIGALARNYSPKYSAYFSNSFSENGASRNETGIYLTMEWQISKNFRINAYNDIFRFPWLTYGNNSPSSGFEKGIQLTITQTGNSEITLRYKEKEKNFSGGTGIPEIIPESYPKIKRQLRLQYSLNKSTLKYRSSLDINNVYKSITKKSSNGASLSQTFSYKPASTNCDISLFISLFDTPDYDNRIYYYEKTIPGFFNMPMLYGQGNRIGLLISYEFRASIKCWLKIGNFSYEGNINQDSEGNVTVRNGQTDIQCLLRIKL